MRQHTEKRVSCPHCGHSISISLDTSNGSQDFYEDCPACCHTIHLDMVINEQFDRVELSIDADDEQIF
ncbi:CPXCG motif-containing cysteine-rich protein [Vibrio sp. Of14-4]|uniref:CPXCG motif-containing cysteine-rich protein n=1 Tax=Vibrio sp. Of14-4 TaxID=2724878 RepID=UPI001EF33936|nr:CPXCG motif-containing cysteine-rich protein [Vibrio sp. Of14-4]MCG7490225.1 CPXCG motif-containing cysteine-rich protein [Vibrio sp. Of14-4]